MKYFAEVSPTNTVIRTILADDTETVDSIKKYITPLIFGLKHLKLYQVRERLKDIHMILQVVFVIHLNLIHLGL